MAYPCLHSPKITKRNKINTPYPEKTNTLYWKYGMNIIFWKISSVVPTPRNPQYANQDNKNKESSRTSVPVETSTSTALVSCDGLSRYDWSDQVEEGPNYALMIFSSLSPDSEVSNYSICSKSCLKTIESLKSKSDQLLKDLKKSDLMVLGYKTRLESVEEKLEVYKSIPPLYTGNFMSPTPDLSFIGLDEFVNKPVVENCKAMSSEEGILRQFSVARTPQQNGVAERRNKTLIEAARTMLVDSKLPTTFWAEAVNTACYRTQSNGFAGTKASDNAGLIVDGSKPSSDDGKKVDEYPRKESECNDQGKEDNVNITNNVNAAGTNKHKFDYSRDDKDDGAEADINNLDTTIQVSPIPTTRIHKDHPLEQVIGDLQSATQTRKMSKNLEEHGFVRRTQKKNSCIEGSKLDRGYAGRASTIQGFEDPDFPDKVYKVEKALYGLHQAPRAWYETLSTYLLDNGFQRGKIDKTLFIKRYKEVKTTSTPMETQKPLLKDEDGEKVDINMYRSMIGSLMYLTYSRPDIKYLKGQPKLGLWYPKDSPFDLVAYTDSEYARASLDKKSTIGGCPFLGCRLILWQCKK
ncbi:putative ribonuclease H-like domain-containing protein [Tanacetum coccineum]